MKVEIKRLEELQSLDDYAYYQIFLRENGELKDSELFPIPYSWENFSTVNEKNYNKFLCLIFSKFKMHKLFSYIAEAYFSKYEKIVVIFDTDYSYKISLLYKKLITEAFNNLTDNCYYKTFTTIISDRRKALTFTDEYGNVWLVYKRHTSYYDTDIIELDYNLHNEVLSYIVNVANKFYTVIHVSGVAENLFQRFFYSLLLGG